MNYPSDVLWNFWAFWKGCRWLIPIGSTCFEAENFGSPAWLWFGKRIRDMTDLHVLELRYTRTCSFDHNQGFYKAAIIHSPKCSTLFLFISWRNCSTIFRMSFNAIVQGKTFPSFAFFFCFLRQTLWPCLVVKDGYCSSSDGSSFALVERELQHLLLYEPCGKRRIYKIYIIYALVCFI